MADFGQQVHALVTDPGVSAAEPGVIKDGLLDLAAFGFGCEYNVAAPGQPPESCGEDTPEGSEYCPTHRYAADGDNSDEPVGFDD